MILKPNDCIALVATGTTWHTDEVVKTAVRYLQQQANLRAIYAEDTYRGLPASERAAILLKHMHNDDVAMIWAIKGGEGSADLLPFLAQQQSQLLQLRPKLLMGYSDFTPLLNYFSQTLDWPVIHGPALPLLTLNKVQSKYAQITFDLLLGRSKGILIEHLQPMNTLAKSDQTVSATIAGGCLSLVSICLKDIWEINTQDKILILEDVGEKAHKISRSLKYLTRIGFFDKAAAVILGDFLSQPIGETAQDHDANASAITKALQLFADVAPCPVLSTTEFGHGSANIPLPFVRATLTLGNTPALKIPFSNNKIVDDEKIGEKHE